MSPPPCKYSSIIDSLKGSMNVFLLTMCCVSRYQLDFLAQLVQGQTEYASTCLWFQCHLILQAILTGSVCDRSRTLYQYFTALICCLIINGHRPVSPYITGVGVCFQTPRVDLQISQQTQNICISFGQHRLSVFNVGPTLYTMSCYWDIGVRA